MVWYGFQAYMWRPSRAVGQQRPFGSISHQEKRQVLRSDKEVERLNDRKEARNRNRKLEISTAPTKAKSRELAYSAAGSNPESQAGRQSDGNGG